jgi:hypothetical protein
VGRCAKDEHGQKNFLTADYADKADAADKELSDLNLL